MSLPVSIASRAEADLAHQYRWYLDNAGVEVAERFLAAFDDTVARLTEQPELGKQRRFRHASLQAFAPSRQAGASVFIWFSTAMNGQHCPLSGSCTVPVTCHGGCRSHPTKCYA